MSDETAMTKAGLTAQIDAAWDKLWAYLAERTPDELTGLQDAEGWTVKDHLSHLVAWHQSVISMFEGQPRHLGLGVDKALWQSNEFDPINAVVQQQRKDVPLEATQDQLRSSYARLMQHLQAISNPDLNRPAGELFPEVVPGETRSPGRIIYDNTAEHYTEHLAWIKALVEQGASS